MDLVNIRNIDRFIVEAVTQFSPECPQLCEYLEDVYERLANGGQGIDLAEIRFIGTLKERDGDREYWSTATFARNQFHHFAHSFNIADKWALIADS